MYVTKSASGKLLASEHGRFGREKWPAMRERIGRLGIDIEPWVRTVSPGGAA